MRGLLRSGDPSSHVAVTSEAKGAVREFYGCQYQTLALEWIDSPTEDLTDSVRSMGDVMIR
jgi:hypothetical protein